MANEKGGRPVYLAKARQSPESEFMIVAGAVWPFKNGDGFVIKLHSLPINWQGDLILVAPKDGE